MNETDILSKITKAGIADQDAKVIADCIVTRKSCSWVNTDPVSRDAVRNLLKLIADNNFKLELSIKEVEARGKYIWEVKAL